MIFSLFMARLKMYNYIVVFQGLADPSAVPVAVNRAKCIFFWQ